MRQIILDTETTGLNAEQGHRIIEIGCIELINRKFTGKTYHQYINPEREVEEGALAVHGISNDFLLNKPLFSTIASDFMSFIQDAELIIHNAPFDVGFINTELNLLNKKWKSLEYYCRIIDTLALARQLHVGQRNSLDALCKRYNVDNSHREYHGALLDAHLLARVYLAMTGGQATLFSVSEATEVVIEQASEIAEPTRKERNLRIIQATPEELATHKKTLDFIMSKGKCLWEEK